MINLTWLDLCSGLGGASQPALDRGWRVIRMDIDSRFKPDIVADVRSLPLSPFPIDVLWISPPCVEYSRFGMRCFFPNPPLPDISIALGALRAVEQLQPKYWIVENVRSSRPWLNPLFGIPILGQGHVFWGRLPCLLPQTKVHKSDLWPSPNRAALRAKIPYEIGEAICIAVERRERICR